MFIKKLCLYKHLDKNALIVIDFYNVYCYLINFKKYRTFSIENWNNTMKCILKTFKHNNIILVSKPIFEINEQHIINYTKNTNRLSYMIIEDNYNLKSLNKERDDYTCIMLQYIFTLKNKKCIIISNDRYLNYNEIITDTKDFNIRLYKSNKIYNTSYTLKNIKDNFKKLKNNQSNLLKNKIFFK
jgi:hypothetical protein